jgi:magnesium chelatase family protein
VIIKYKKRLSGPLLDRIDLHISIPPVEIDKLTDHFESESSAMIRKRVLKAREQQMNRFQKKQIQFNTEMSSQDIKEVCILEEKAKDLLKQAVQRLSLSARSYFKTIKVAQTIADLEQSPAIQSHHIAEALQYRSQEL